MIADKSLFARGLVSLALIFALTGFVSVEALFAPKAELWQRWQTHDPASQETIDHGAWDDILALYVIADDAGLNRFDYEGVTKADRDGLGAYIKAMAALPVSAYSRAEQQAYWINLYNALTVELILQHYPVPSILDIDISPGLFADGPWDRPLLNIEGETVSLNDIEHRILRPIWQDPRIHYAVNCASVGCPNLQDQAFTAANMETLLEVGARSYVNSPRGATFEGGKLVVSSIYVWFGEDFGGSDVAVIQHLKRYADEGLAAELKDIKAIGDHRYDWDLNEQIDSGV